MATRKAKTSTEVLKAALWILENVGWVKHESVRMDIDGQITGFCASGALRQVETDDDGYAARGARRLLDSVIPGNKHLVNFNDDQNTSKKDVLNIFKRAIEKGAK